MSSSNEPSKPTQGSNTWFSPSNVRQKEVPRMTKEAQTTIAFAIASTLFEKRVSLSLTDVCNRFHKAFHGVDNEEVTKSKEGKDASNDGDTLDQTKAGDEVNAGDEKDGAREKKHDDKEASTEKENHDRKRPADGGDEDTKQSGKTMVDLFLTGQGPFSNLVYLDSDGFLKIHNFFTRRSKTITLGQNLTRQKLVSIKQGKLLVGRTLYEQFERAHLNCKRAIRIWEEYNLSKKGTKMGAPTESNGLGHIDEEFVMHLLDRMHEEQELEKKKQNVEDLTKGDTTEETKSIKKRDEKWFFNGFWAFMLYGPMASPEFRSQLMNESVHSLLAKKARKEPLSFSLSLKRPVNEPVQREQLPTNTTFLSVTQQKRETPPLDTIFNKNMTNEQRLELIKVAQQQEELTFKNEEAQFSALTRQITSLEEEHRGSIEVAKVFKNSTGNPNPDQACLKQIREIQCQLKQKRREVDDLMQKKRQRLEARTSAESLTKAYIEALIIPETAVTMSI